MFVYIIIENVYFYQNRYNRHIFLFVQVCYVVDAWLNIQQYFNLANLFQEIFR